MVSIKAVCIMSALICLLVDRCASDVLDRNMMMRMSEQLEDVESKLERKIQEVKEAVQELKSCSGVCQGVSTRDANEWPQTQ